GWDEGKWASNYPTNQALSAATPNNPVFLVGLHTFAAWANQRALELAGVNKDTKDPENGKILRDEKTGEPTGILLNHAQELVSKHIPPMTLVQANVFGDRSEEHTSELQSPYDLVCRLLPAKKKRCAATEACPRRGGAHLHCLAD